MGCSACLPGPIGRTRSSPGAPRGGAGVAGQRARYLALPLVNVKTRSHAGRTESRDRSSSAGGHGAGVRRVTARTAYRRDAGHARPGRRGRLDAFADELVLDEHLVGHPEHPRCLGSAAVAGIPATAATPAEPVVNRPWLAKEMDASRLITLRPVVALLAPNAPPALRGAATQPTKGRSPRRLVRRVDLQPGLSAELVDV